MSETKRNILTSTQKAKIALATVKGQKTINEIAQEFGVHLTSRTSLHPPPEGRGFTDSLVNWSVEKDFG